jgi:hypothetical protein
VTALAGPAAERKFVGYPVGAAMMLKGSAWASDYRNASDWLGRIRGVSLEQAERMARHLVDRDWDAITSVAEALADAGELDRVTLDRLWRE